MVTKKNSRSKINSKSKKKVVSSKKNNKIQELYEIAVKLAKKEFNITEKKGDIKDNPYFTYSVEKHYLDLEGKIIKRQLYENCLKKAFKILKVPFSQVKQENLKILRNNQKLKLLITELYFNKPLIFSQKEKYADMNEICKNFDRACREIIGTNCPVSVNGLTKLFKNTKNINKIITRYNAIEKSKINNTKIIKKKKKTSKKKSI